MDSGLKKGQNPNPIINANPISRILFGWVLDIFKKGYKKDLEVEDLYDALQEHRSDVLGNKLERLWNRELKRANALGQKASLLRVLVIAYGPYAMFLGLFLAFTELLLQTSQPLFMGRLIRYFSRKDVSRSTAYLYAACIVLTSSLNVIIKHPYAMAIFHTGMKMRVGLCSLIYRKALRLSKTALGETTVGQAVNLLSNDVSRFDPAIIFLGYIWVGPLQTLIITYLMWQEIGISAIIGVATVLLIIPVQGFFGKMISKLRLRTAKRTDQRIRFMNEIIVGIQVIKMYAWEKPFAHLVSLARKREIRAVRLSSYMRGLLLSVGKCGSKISIFISIVTYVLLDNEITSEKMFVVTAYFNIIRYSMADFIPLAITQLAEASVSVGRIRTFLLYDEIDNVTELNERMKVPSGNDEEYKEKNRDTQRESLDLKTTSEKENSNHLSATANSNKKDGYHNEETKDFFDCPNGIRISNATAKWSKDVTENTLTNVNLDVRPGELVAIIGPVGSGKTSLLHAILKELPLSSGSSLVGGTISYASQEPWLFTGSVRQNILFGQAMDRGKYKKVVQVCALERDFQLLPHGDKTIVGERGVTLSGGQRARINLARAIYKEADIYLLDDPLSAVDTHVGRHLFDDCICDFLQNKTRVLVTHQLQYLQTADKIVLLNSGIVEATGTYSELHESGLDFAKQLSAETEQEEEEKDDKDSYLNNTNMTAYRLVRQISEDSLHFPMRQISEVSTMGSATGSEPHIVAEMRSLGKVSSKVYTAYCAAAGNCTITFLVFGLCVLSQIAVSSGDYWMSYWSNVEEQRTKLKAAVDKETWNEPTTGSDDYVTTLPYVNTTNMNATNITEWDWLLTTETCIFIYTGIVIAIILLVLGSAICFYTMCMRASVRLHNTMFNSITRATMWFFNNNPSGQILNRFSKDMGSVDESLPQTMIDCIQIGLMLLGVVLVVAIVNVWLLIPTALMFAVLYMLRQYYVSTSRSVKRLEGITRSPVFSHLNASLQGLTTIRAFKAELLLKKEFDGHQDLHSSAWFLFIASSRAFGLWLDSACLVYIALVTFSFLFMGGEQFGGNVGLAITQAIGLTGMLQWGMRQSAELENNMTSLERILEYTKIESEPPLDSLPGKKPHGTWPSEGAVVFDKAVFAYSSDSPPVLKNVSFAVRPTEKVGIVGRTGAGKSSLISALFRLVDLRDGSIKIDGVDTVAIGLHDLRSKISIIPQEPALFSGTLRENLDPFNQYTDASLWSALSEVELKQAIDDLPAGLSHRVSEGGSNFSVGQRQLLCLARAIIRNNKILVLDEATANVDPQTDELIQKTIRHKFADCTVLTIAHRLHTVMDSDRVIVMDAGTVVEFDHPYILLKNENGVFYQMVEQTGHTMAESLFRVAQTCYEKKVEKMS